MVFNCNRQSRLNRARTRAQTALTFNGRQFNPKMRRARVSAAGGSRSPATIRRHAVPS